MCTKPGTNRAPGYTLIEVIVSMGVFTIAGLALVSVFLFSLKSFAAMGNYAALDRANREAMDLLTREIRQARQVTSYSTNSITIVNGSSLAVTYLFRPSTSQLVRTASDGSSQVLLDDCKLIEFRLFQRNPVSGSYDIYPVATNNWQQTVKVVQLSWKSSRSSFNGLTQSENVQTARIVIRKQKKT
jgi:type II secretory pathway component PulJ